MTEPIKNGTKWDEKGRNGTEWDGFKIISHSWIKRKLRANESEWNSALRARQPHGGRYVDELVNVPCYNFHATSSLPAIRWHPVLIGKIQSSV